MSATTESTIPDALLQDLARIVGTDRVLSSRDELLVYECDGYVVEKNVPDVGKVCWFDLTVPDAEKVRDFYGEVVDFCDAIP